jgi:hypothetical protein
MRIGRLERAWAAEELCPAVGWKVWRVEDGLLRSVLYGDPWRLGEPARATCRRHVHVSHQAPALYCECGIHAGRELGAWDHYLSVGAESRVFGRVLLWGSVLEGTAGWRGELARPVEIFVPPAVVDAPDVAESLRAYGVAVHTLEPMELPQEVRA